MSCRTKLKQIKSKSASNEQNERRNFFKNELDIINELKKQFKIKNCFVKLNFMHTEKSAMDETSPAPSESSKRRPGRKPKASSASKSTETPTKPSDKSKSEEKVNDSENDEKTELIGSPIPKVDKSSVNEKKQVKKESTELVIDSGGRGKRTRKPNPKYMDDESLVSATKHLGRDDSAESENAEGEDGDDEMQSSDEPRNEGPLKKRMLQKHGMKSLSARKPVTSKSTPMNAGRKSVGSVVAKRKLEPDIDIDDEHGKQLFLDAKRRLTQSPSNSEEDFGLRKGKNNVTGVLAAKLRAKFPGEFIVKRTVVSENKSITSNRNRIYERSIIGLQKNEDIKTGQHILADETETSEDDSLIIVNASDHETTSPKNNRRKTQHTKILSDDRIVRSAPAGQVIRRGPPGTFLKQINKPPLSQNHGKTPLNVPTKTYSISGHSLVTGSNKPAILRPPPRILNSTLCKPPNKSTVPSLVTKLVTKDDYEQDVNGKRANNMISSRLKENVTSYTYTEKDGKMIPKKTMAQLPQNQQQIRLLQQRKTVLPVVRTQHKHQKIISEPVSLNLPHSRRIRKITCFETWYVIKMVDEQPKVEKSVLNISLMQIGNEIKKIELPSDEWTYKILLQPLSKQLLAMRKTKANDTLSTKIAELDEKTVGIIDNMNRTVELKSETHSEESPEAEAKTDESTRNEESKSSADNRMVESSSQESNENALNSETESIGSIGNGKQKQDKETDEEENIDTTRVKVIKGEKIPDDSIVESSKAKHDIYWGEVHDPNIKAEERHNYRPINIMFRRKCQNPNVRIQFDRTVILKNQTFYLNIDGKNVRLVASPQSIDTYDDIKALLQIINDIDLNSCYVELATHAA